MNTSSGYHAATGGKLKKHKGGKSKSSNTQKLPAALSARMKKPKAEQQELMPTWLSAYGVRRKAKMRGF